MLGKWLGLQGNVCAKNDVKIIFLFARVSALTNSRSHIARMAIVVMDSSLPVPKEMPPRGTTLYWCLDIEAEGGSVLNHIPCFTVRIGDSLGQYPKLVEETFVFQKPPEVRA
jgi:hypothetical protein